MGNIVQTNAKCAKQCRNVVPHPSTVPSFAQFLGIFGKCIAIIVRAVVNLSKLDSEKTEKYDYFKKV